MTSFEQVVSRARELHDLANFPLQKHQGRVVLRDVDYPGESEVIHMLWLLCIPPVGGYSGSSPVREKRIAEVARIMDEIEPKLRRWAESMAELNDLVLKALELRTHTTLLGDVLTEEQRRELLG
jgi:hypothetical protein